MFSCAGREVFFGGMLGDMGEFDVVDREVQKERKVRDGGRIFDKFNVPGQQWVWDAKSSKSWLSKLSWSFSEW